MANGTTDNLRWIEVADLLLDPENPRLIVPPNADQGTLARALYEEEGVDELVPSLLENGYFREEPLVVVPAREDEKFTVVEGNRRLTALKLILDPSLRRAIEVEDWPPSNAEQANRLRRVPCVVYDSRKLVLPYLGFRHITGARKWAPFQRARFVAQMVDGGMPLAEIQELIGDNSQTVKKLYQDFIVFNQVGSDVGLEQSSVRDRFSLLEVTLGQRNIKKFLGMPASLPTTSTTAIVPEEHLDQLEEVVGWVFGTTEKRPVISESRDISSRLSPVLANPAATEYLRETNDLERAYDFSGGEKAFLLKRASSAERSLRDLSSLAGVYANDEDFINALDRLELIIRGIRRVVN